LGGENIQAIYQGPQDIPAEHRIFTEPGEAKHFLKLNNADIAATIMKLNAVCGGDNMLRAADNLKTLIGGKNRDYLLLINCDDIMLFPTIDAYKRGTEAYATTFLYSSKSLDEQADIRLFAIRVIDRGEDGKGSVTGDFIELNGKALCANIILHAAAPDGIDAVFLDGAEKSYDLRAWRDMLRYTREDVMDYTRHFSSGELAEAAGRYAFLTEANETSCKSVGVDTFLSELNTAYMAAARNPQPDMIRVTNEAAKYILARGEADVYRLTPDGAVKLAPTEAARPLCFAEHRELAIKREDLAGLDRWAKRAADKLLSQNERGARDKSKNKREEL
jgi:hypothetical protein